MSKISVSESLRIAAEILEAGIFSDVVNKIRTTLSKIPQAQEVLRLIAGLDPRKALEKLKKSVGEVDEETFKAALKMVKTKAAPEMSGSKSAADLKKIIMTALLLMIVSNLTGKAVAQDHMTFNKQLNDTSSISDSKNPENPFNFVDDKDPKDAPTDTRKIKIDPNVYELLKIITSGFKPGDRFIPPSESMQFAYADAKAHGKKVETKSDIQKMMKDYYSKS